MLLRDIYVIYQPDANRKAFTLNLRPGSYRVEWIQCITGQRRPAGAIEATAGTRRFVPPFNGGAVVWLGKD